jgi:stalled ribosome rescue protein Dom34
MNKDNLKLEIIKQLDKDDKQYDSISCEESLRNMRAELERRMMEEKVIIEEIQIKAYMIIMEIAELLIPDELCRDDKPNRKKIQKFMFSVVDAFCDGANSVVDDDDASDDELDDMTDDVLDAEPPINRELDDDLDEEFDDDFDDEFDDERGLQL